MISLIECSLWFLENEDRLNSLTKVEREFYFNEVYPSILNELDEVYVDINKTIGENYEFDELKTFYDEFYRNFKQGLEDIYDELKEIK